MVRRRKRVSTGQPRFSTFGRLGVVVVVLTSLAALLTSPATAGSTTTSTTAAGIVRAGGLSGSDWPGYLHGAGHSSYNALATSITPANVGSLQKMWQWLPPASTNSGSTASYASPTVANGVVYFGLMDGEFYAISRTTHQVLWSQFIGIDAPLGSCRTLPTHGVIATATVSTDKSTGKLAVYIFGPDGFLYAMDAATGVVLWKGLVYTPSTTVNDYFAWGSPTVANGKVYVGISSFAECPMVPSGIVSFDQHTGSQLAKWSSIPNGVVGASVWTSPAIMSDGSVVVTTGNTKNTFQPLYAESIVRLDGTTLALRDSWQLPVGGQIRDADFGGSPTLFTATINGLATPMVGACNKNGWYYALAQNNLSAGPVWQDQITIPYPGAGVECDSAAIWDGNNLIETGGAPSTAQDPADSGSIQSLDPATGQVRWMTHLDGIIVGSPSENGSGVVAAPTYLSSTNQLGLYLVQASTGTVIGFLPTPKANLFGQAVFAGPDLLLAATGYGLADYAVGVAPTLTNVSVPLLADGIARTVAFTGTGFQSGARVTFGGSPNAIKATKVVITPTSIRAKISVPRGTPAGTYSVSVINPGGGTGTCEGCFAVVTSPTVTAISPASLTIGQVASVTVTGTGFTAGAKVLGPTGVTFTTVTVTSPTSITATATVSAAATTGAALPVEVKNSATDGYGSGTGNVLTIGP
jgi:polyvinyl alcohol dehydrogenase (cytochrome)